MSRFLDSLVRSNRVPLYIDFRTGSLKDLGGFGNHITTIDGTPTWRTSRGRSMFIGRSSGFRVTSAASLNLSALSIVATGQFDMTRMAANARIVIKDTGTVEYDFYFSPVGGTIWFQSTGGSQWVLPRKQFRSVGTTWASGSAPRFFLDDSFGAVGAGVVTHSGASVGTLNIGMYTPSATFWFLNNPMRTLALVNEPLSDADMCRLMRELDAAPGVVARARKAFSIPYPSKTPAEYAAAGITLDARADRVNGSIVDLVSGISATSLPTGRYDARLTDGPFDKSLKGSGLGCYADFPTAVGNLPAGNSDWSLEMWTTRPANAATVPRLFARAFAAPPYWYLDCNTLRFRIWTNSGVGGLFFNNGIALPAGGTTQWYHVVVTNTYGGLLTLYTDTIASAPTDVSAQTGTMSSPDRTVISDDMSHTVAGDNSWVMARVHNHALTIPEIRANYLEGARKCVGDYTVHSDGSCPVSLAAVGAGNEIANCWKVQSGTWKVVEDAPSGGRAGERWLKAQAAATVSIRCNPQAFGSWWGKIRFNGVEQEWLFVATNETSVSAATQNGYGIHVTAGGALTLRERAAGAAAAILTPGVVLANGTEYEFWTTRRADGLFDLNIKGGAYANWTSLGTVTDTTTTQGGYQVLYGAGANVESRGAMAFLGEMTTIESVALKLIS